MAEKKFSSKKKATKKHIVKKEEKVEKVKADLVDEADEEPRWYHYVIVAGAFILFFAGLYFVLDYFEDKTMENSGGVILYDYYFEEGERSGRIQFYNSVEEIEEMNYPIEISKAELLNSREIYLSFDNYNGTDNGQVVKVSARLLPFLRSVYLFEIEPEKHVMLESEFSCLNSTPEVKVIEFDPYSDRTGVFYDESTGCIRFLADSPAKMPEVGDKFFYTLINE